MFRKLLTAQAATLVALASLLAVSQVQAVTIGSFDGSRSGRLFSGSDYDNIRTHLADPANFGPAGIVNDTVTFAPDIATASAATLAGTDIFVLTETNSLSNAELDALAQFVLDGNCLIVSTDSGSGSRVGGNQILNRLDAGAIAGPLGGAQGDNVGTFTAAGASTVGPFGNLVGLNFDATPGSTLSPGIATNVVGQTGTDFDILAEIFAGALGPGSGGVLVSTDVLFMDFFVPPGSLFGGNQNNALAFMNFVAGHAIPEPGTVLLLAVGLVACGARHQRRG